jgi:hypothetical protein
MYDDPQCVPALLTLPMQRRYIDSHRCVSINEFTIQESLTYPAAVYPVLADGGIYDGKSDPFDLQTSVRGHQAPFAPSLHPESTPIQILGKTVRIGFRTVITGDVTVEIYSVMGKRIIHHQTEAAGRSTLQITLPSKGLAPGIYICQIASGEARAQAKISVTR